MGKFVYAVARGRTIGIYEDWTQCKVQVDGFQDARYKKFASRAEAEQFIADNSKKEPGHKRTTLLKRKLPETSSIPEKKPKEIPADGTPEVYTDGACSSNGALHAKAGWGVYWGADHVDNLCGPVEGAATNNRGELQAVREALNQAINKKIPSIIVHTDSKLVINSLDEWIGGWRRNGWKTRGGQPVKNTDLLEAISNQRKSIKVHFKYVAGHSGNEGNEAADALARRGALQYHAH